MRITFAAFAVIALAVFLTACQTTESADDERFVWGEETNAPMGWYSMCARDPEAFSCPDAK